MNPPPPPDSMTSSSSSSLASSSLFDVKEWLSKIELSEYYDQFVASGYKKKAHFLQIKKDVGGNLSELKRILSEDDIQIDKADTRLLLNALNELN